MGYIVGEVTGRLEDGRPSEIKPYDLSALYGDTLTFGEASAYLLNADREDKQNGILDAPEMVVVTEQALANVTEQRPELTVSMSSKDSPVLIDRFLKASSEEWKLQTDHGGMHGEHSDKPSVYFDIDGTLGKWYADGRGYSSLEEIIDPENHYFRDIEPHPFMVQLAQHLQEEGYDVCVISAADRDTIRDKMEWVQKNLPFVPEENVFFSPLGADKTKFIKDNAEISVLIDDYNVNLEAWTGKAIKAINTVNSHQDKYAEIDMTVPERMLERHEQRKAEVEQMIEEGWLPETAAEDIKTSFAESMANHIMRATEVVAEAIGEAVRENVIKKTNDVPLQVFEQIKKAAQELEEAPVDGKYFGYDIHDIEEALKTEEGTTKFIDKLYEIDSSFGADPMYWGVAPAPMTEQFLKENGYGLNYDREMRLEEIEHEEEMRLHYTDSEKVKGLRLEMYNDGSGSATLNGERIAEVDLMTREYKLSRPNKETGKPEFDTGYDYDIDLDKAKFMELAEWCAVNRYGVKELANEAERNEQGMVTKEDGGYSVNGQHIDESAARELANFIDMENYREDIRSVIEEQYGDVVADAVSDDLLNKVTQTYADNRGDGEEWRTYAENAVSEFRTEIESAGQEHEEGNIKPYHSESEWGKADGFEIKTDDGSTVRVITGEDGRETRPRMFTQELGTQPKYFGEGAKLGEKAEGEALEILSSLPDSSAVPANVREWAKETLATANEMIQKMEENGFKTFEVESAIGTIAIEPFVQQGLGRDAQNIGEIEGYTTDSDVIQGGGSSIYGYAQEIVNAAELQREAFKDKVDLQEFYDSKVFPIKDIPYENLNEEQHNTLSFYSDWHKDNYGIRPHDESRDMCYQTHMRHEAQKEEAMKTDITQYVMSVEEPMFSDNEAQSVNFSMPMYDEGLKNMLDRTALLDKSFDYNTFDDVVNSDFDTLNAYVDTFLDENGKVQANATIELSGERVTLEASVPLTEAEAQKLVELAEQEFAKDGSRSLETALKEENAKATERVFESEKIEGLKVHIREDNTGVIERNGKGLYKFDLDNGTISNYLSPTTGGNLGDFGIESAEDMLPLAESLAVQVTQSKTVEGLSFHTLIDDQTGYATLNGEKFVEYDLNEGDTNFQNKGWEKWGTTDMEKLAHFAETYAVNNLGAQEIQSPMKWFEPEKYEPECLEADGGKYNFNLYVGDNTETAMGMFVEATAVVDRKSGEISVSIDNEGQCFTRDESYNETFYPIPEDVAESVVDKVRECTIDEVVKDILKEEKADHPDGYTYDYWGQGAEIDDSMMNEAVQDFVKQMHEHNGEYASAPTYDTPDFKDYLTSKVVSEWLNDVYEEENIYEAFSYGKTQGELDIINEYVENHGLSGVGELLSENDFYMDYDISSIVGEHQLTLYLATSNEVNHDSSIISTMCNNEGLQALDKQLSERSEEDVDHHFDSALTYMVYAMGQDMTTVMQEHYGVKESGDEFVKQVAEAFNEMSPNSNAELAICVKLDNDSLDLITQIGKQEGYITVPEGTEMHLFDRLNGYESDEIRNPEPFTFSAADADWQSKHQVAEINVVQVYDKNHRDGYADCQLDSDDYPRDLKSATKAEGEPAEIADKAQKIADAMHGDIPNVKESISNDVRAMETKEKTDKTKKATDDFGNR